MPDPTTMTAARLAELDALVPGLKARVKGASICMICLSGGEPIHPDSLGADDSLTFKQRCESTLLLSNAAPELLAEIRRCHALMREAASWIARADNTGERHPEFDRAMSLRARLTEGQ
jgi:hypothetical protein